MGLRSYASVLGIRQPLAQWLLLRDAQTYIRVQFLVAAVRCGLLRALREPRGRAALIAELGVVRHDLLDRLLQIGIVLKEVDLRGGRYRLTGARSRALADDAGDQLAAMLEEIALYHGSVYRDLPERLRGAPPGAYIDEYASVIALSSRVLEPFIGPYAAGLVRGRGALRLLEIGCGTGIYLRYVAEANAAVHGIALEVQPEVARGAAANLTAWGVADRFRVVTGDARTPPDDVRGPFDLITLHNNIYYFDREERRRLLGQLHSWLTASGRLAITSFMQGKTLGALDFDLALRCTEGCTPLPALGALTAQLRSAGFARIEPTALAPFEPLYGLVATIPP